MEIEPVLADILARSERILAPGVLLLLLGVPAADWGVELAVVVCGDALSPTARKFLNLSASLSTLSGDSGVWKLASLGRGGPIVALGSLSYSSESERCSNSSEPAATE